MKKCLFRVKALDFVGYEVYSNSITPLKRKVEAITKFPSPQKQKKLLGYLRAVNDYRKSMPNYNGKSAATILQPQYKAATRKMDRNMFSKYWKQNGLQSVFEESKLMLANYTPLVHPDPNAQLALTTE